MVLVVYLLTVFILFDIISTEVALRMGGKELNPIMRNKWIRWVLTGFLKIGIIVFFIWIDIKGITQSIPTRTMILILTIHYGIVVINNSIILRKLVKRRRFKF